MNHRIVVLLALGSASACAVLFSACGGSDNTNVDGGGNDATTNDVATTDSPTSDTGNNDTGVNKDGGVPDAACNKGPGCNQCCTGLYPDAAAFFTATEEQCACTTPGDCKQQCGNTLCQGKPPGVQSLCEACLRDKDAGDCRGAATSACVNNAECAPLAACVASCGNIGPTDAGGGG